VAESGPCSVDEKLTRIGTVNYKVGIDIIGKIDESEDFVTRITGLEELCRSKKMDNAQI
jgi:hypothetical protein